MKVGSSLFLSITLIALLALNNFAQPLHGAITLPEYPDGLCALEEFIRENLNFNEVPEEEGIPGIVTLSFVVNREGKVEDIKILRGINAQYDSEAVRVTRLIKDWKPAVQWNKTVDMRVILPFRFILKKSSGEFNVSGTVTDKLTGKPLEGVLVVVKDSDLGTMTDQSGIFNLNVTEDAELEFIYVGYENKSEKVLNNRTINPSLIAEDLIIDFDAH